MSAARPSWSPVSGVSSRFSEPFLLPLSAKGDIFYHEHTAAKADQIKSDKKKNEHGDGVWVIGGHYED